LRQQGLDGVGVDDRADQPGLAELLAERPAEALVLLG
jgi:hypothetical protein